MSEITNMENNIIDRAAKVEGLKQELNKLLNEVGHVKRERSKDERLAVGALEIFEQYWCRQIHLDPMDHENEKLYNCHRCNFKKPDGKCEVRSFMTIHG